MNSYHRVYSTVQCALTQYDFFPETELHCNPDHSTEFGHAGRDRLLFRCSGESLDSGEKRERMEYIESYIQAHIGIRGGLLFFSSEYTPEYRDTDGGEVLSKLPYSSSESFIPTPPYFYFVGLTQPVLSRL